MRESQTVRFWSSFASWVITPAIRNKGPNTVHRAVVLMAVLPVMTFHVGVVSIMLLLDGLIAEAVTLSSLVFVGVGVLQYTRRTGRVKQAAYFAALLVLVGLSLTILRRGGMHAPAAMGLSFVPLVMTFLAGERMGVVWGFITLLFIAGLSVVSTQLELKDAVSENTGNLLQMIAPALATVVGMGLAYAFERSRLAALDVARQHEREANEAQTLAQLAQAERLASVGQLAAGVAHEINNPLAYIIGNLEWLLGPDVELEKEAKEAVGEILEGAQRVSRIVTDLKSFSRSEETREDSCCHVKNTIDLALKIANVSIRHQALVERLGDEDNWIAIDSTRFVQVLVNLLLNSAHAIAARNDEQNLISLSINSDTDNVSIDVKDTGIGMTPEELVKIFDPFHSTKPIGVGTGLGMSVCRGIVEANGGTIEVSSEQGVGTTVTVSLPRADPPASPLEHSEEPLPHDGVVGLRILVVDDELLVRKALVRVLAAHEVVLACDANEALHVLRQDSQFHLVLSDLMMPEGSGLELYEGIVAEHKHLIERLVFMTGGVLTQEVSDFIEQVPNPTLQKPIDQDMLLFMLRQSSKLKTS